MNNVYLSLMSTFFYCVCKLASMCKMRLARRAVSRVLCKFECVAQFKNPDAKHNCRVIMCNPKNNPRTPPNCLLLSFLFVLFDRPLLHWEKRSARIRRDHREPPWATWLQHKRMGCGFVRSYLLQSFNCSSSNFLIWNHLPYFRLL